MKALDTGAKNRLSWSEMLVMRLVFPGQVDYAARIHTTVMNMNGWS